MGRPLHASTAAPHKLTRPGLWCPFRLLLDVHQKHRELSAAVTDAARASRSISLICWCGLPDGALSWAAEAFVCLVYTCRRFLGKSFTCFAPLLHFSCRFLDVSWDNPSRLETASPALREQLNALVARILDLYPLSTMRSKCAT